MYMIKNLLLLLLLSLALNGKAQQLAQYSFYMLNPSLFNPAYAGMEESLSLTGVFRQQWAGLEGAPRQQALTAHMPLYFLSSGIGLSFENDEVGARQYSNYSLQYNYQLQMGSGVLSIGANADLTQINWNGTQLLSPDGIYTNGQIDHRDNLLPTTDVGAFTPTFGFGLFYKSQKLKLGASVKNINEPSVSFVTVALPLNRHLYFMGSYEMDLTRRIEFIPSVLLRSDLIELQTDASVQFRFDGNIFVGGGVRGFGANSLDGVSVFGGWQVSERMMLAYNYDISTSYLANVNGGSHEILLKYTLKEEIGKGKLPKMIYNPRFL